MYLCQNDGDDSVEAECKVCLAGIPCVQYPAQGQDSHTHHQLLVLLSVKLCYIIRELISVSIFEQKGKISCGHFKVSSVKYVLLNIAMCSQRIFLDEMSDLVC